MASKCFLEWSSRNATAEFYFEVRSGSSTPQQDTERINNAMFANQVVQQWLQNPTAEGLQLAILYVGGS